jgi:hypothetical protein
MHHVDRAFEKMKERNWDCIYFAIDVHGTILKSTYKKDLKFEFYDGAEEVLRYMSTRDDIKMIVYSSSHKAYLESLIEFLLEKHIYFDYVNENPEVETNELSDFDSKLYFDVLLDDKAGFDPTTDWKRLLDSLSKHPNQNNE